MITDHVLSIVLFAPAVFAVMLLPMYPAPPQTRILMWFGLSVS